MQVILFQKLQDKLHDVCGLDLEGGHGVSKRSQRQLPSKMFVASVGVVLFGAVLSAYYSTLFPSIPVRFW